MGATNARPSFGPPLPALTDQALLGILEISNFQFTRQEEYIIGKRTLPLLTLLLLLSLCGCTKRFSIVNPVKVTIQKGLDLVEVTDSGTVAALTRQITDMEFRRGESSRDMTGWEYWLKWYDQDGNVLFDCTVVPKSINYDG